MIWSKKGKQKSNGVKTLFILLALVMILPLAVGALLLNDVGQLFNLPTSWVFNFYYYRIPISIAACILAILLVIYQCIHKVAKKSVMVVLLLVVASSLFLTHLFVPDFFSVLYIVRRNILPFRSVTSFSRVVTKCSCLRSMALPVPFRASG